MHSVDYERIKIDLEFLNSAIENSELIHWLSTQCYFATSCTDCKNLIGICQEDCELHLTLTAEGAIDFLLAWK